jgi:hypothetical protein
MPAESLLPVVTAMIAKIADARIMILPMNSKRTASHRFALTLGK